MQVLYHSSYLQQEYNRQMNAQNINNECNKLVEDIIKFETKSPNDYDAIATLYRKIFNYLLFKNKLYIYGKYSNIQLTTPVANIVDREVAAALESVLPRVGLRPFISLSISDKEAQLVELSNIVLGIRLFNKEIKKGGIGLDSFEDITIHEGRQLLNSINVEVAKAIEICDDYTIFFSVIDELGESYSKEEICLYKDELVLKRQYLINLLELKSDVQESEKKVLNLESKYKKKLAELNELIGSKSSIPKDQVYPRFDTLAKSYHELIEEKMISQHRTELFKVLYEFKDKLSTSLSSAVIKQARPIYVQKGNKEKEDEKVVEETLQTTSISDKVKRLMPNSTPDFMHIPLDYLGFCIVTLVKKDGLLIPGKPNIGVIKYGEKYCVFSSIAALEEFVGAPEEYMNEVRNVCKKHPELIHLLKIGHEFPEVSFTTMFEGREGAKPMFAINAPLMVDKEIETPVHFIESNIVPDYCWNEWELRKKAIHMANIRNKVTVSCQTVLSNFKRENETQVWLPKEEGVNTVKYGSTNTELPKTYIVGLRQHS